MESFTYKWLRAGSIVQG